MLILDFLIVDELLQISNHWFDIFEITNNFWMFQSSFSRTSFGPCGLDYAYNLWSTTNWVPIMGICNEKLWKKRILSEIFRSGFGWKKELWLRLLRTFQKFSFVLRWNHSSLNLFLSVLTMFSWFLQNHRPRLPFFFQFSADEFLGLKLFMVQYNFYILVTLHLTDPSTFTTAPNQHKVHPF